MAAVVGRPIAGFAKDELLRARLGRQAKTWATGIFSLEQSANDLEAVYADVMARRRKRR